MVPLKSPTGLVLAQRRSCTNHREETLDRLRSSQTAGKQSNPTSQPRVANKVLLSVTGTLLVVFGLNRESKSWPDEAGRPAKQPPDGDCQNTRPRRGLGYKLKVAVQRTATLHPREILARGATG
jgi:hypothetical protein